MLDNAKFIIIFFVVFGHMIEPLIHQSSIIKIIYMAIYSFHMPAFVIISGMLSNADLSSEQIAKLVNSIIVPFIAFTFLYELFNLLMQGDISSYTKNLEPFWILWFLSSLFVWRLFLPAFLKFRFPIFIAFIISVAAGYFESIGYFLGISRTLYFFPFFIIGYKLTPSIFTHIKLKNIPKLVLLGIIAANLVLFSFFHDMQYQWFYGSYSYPMLASYGWLAGATRIAVYGLSFLTVMSILLLIPSKKMVISGKGRNSLHVYVWHGFFIKVCISTGLIGAVGQLPAIIVLICLFALSSALTFMLFSGLIEKSTQRFIINPARIVFINES
jgi:fucose 4-O-acetylase-like acetyltransferase